MELDKKSNDILKDGIDRIPTGIPSLDDILGGGLPRGSLTLITARPGMGNTSFALQLAGNIATAGGRVLFFELEMTKEQLLNRIHLQCGGAPTLDTLYLMIRSISTHHISGVSSILSAIATRHLLIICSC